MEHEYNLIIKRKVFHKKGDNMSRAKKNDTEKIDIVKPKRSKKVVQSTFDITSQPTYDATLSAQYSEKIVCKDCGNITFRQPEIHTLKTSIDDNDPFYATIVHKFICPTCKSENFVSSLVKGQISEEDNIITAKI